MPWNFLHGSENAFVLKSPHDPKPIAEACTKLLEPDIRLRMAENARRFAVSQPWEIPALLHLRRYAALLDRKAVEPARATPQAWAII